ncbi:aspartate/glutamate racemase family protein [Rhizobium sp. TH2]|uniref:aspartate/glutamate racemase family protein n=1 Tax=Rhizobium sp. TH2 TaxID=2775403 RepID=UPI0021583E0C|nr:aspartate/glutamate racemase family protein [Rhizobium sp. TH2]UVC06693.1 aspartate/glutamate racemase family protein [Rhizobium sp. TH2]
MKTIGLIGGMSFESTAVYYDLLNNMARDRFGGLASAEILLHSVNFADIVALQQSGRWDEAGKRLSAIAANLEKAGADCVLICTNTMHKIAGQVQAAISVPLVDIIDETATALKARGCKRPLLLATRYTMEDGFYHAQMSSYGIEVMTSEKAGRDRIHSIIFDELCKGKVLDSSRAEMLAIIDAARSTGADSIILGCTEICLLLDPNHLPLPGVDSTLVHCQAASEFAFTDDTALDGVRKYA